MSGFMNDPEVIIYGCCLSSRVACVACVAVFCFCRGRRGHCAMGHRAPRWCNFLGRTRSRDSYDLRVAPLPKTCLVQFCSLQLHRMRTVQ